MSERRYTLSEADLELRRRECIRDGHDLEWVTRDGELVSVYCGRCSRKWAVFPAVEGSQSDCPEGSVG